MDIIGFLLVGLVAGWIASHLMKGRGFGLIGNIVVGGIGALIGGFLFRMVGVVAYGTLGTIIMAVVGAVVFLFLISLMKHA